MQPTTTEGTCGIATPASYEYDFFLLLLLLMLLLLFSFFSLDVFSHYYSRGDSFYYSQHVVTIPELQAGSFFFFLY